MVNHEPAKAALLLAAVDPNIGGVALFGRRGTCKTVLARAVHALLPALEEAEEDEEEKKETAVVEESATHARPRRPPPFVTVPLSATEDAVVGTIDVEASARVGEPVYEPGLLARADRGVLYLDELNLADEAVVDCALHAVSARRCVVERTGVSTSRPCRALCVATWNPDEGEVKRRVVDAFALHASADEPLAVERRVRGVELASAWMDDWRAVAEEARLDEAALAAAVAAARKTLARVRVTDAQVGWIRFYHTRVEYLDRLINFVVTHRWGGSWTSRLQRGAWDTGRRSRRRGRARRPRRCAGRRWSTEET